MDAGGTCPCLGDDANAAQEALRAARCVDDFVDESHFGAGTKRCVACGEHSLTLFCERVDWADSDDPPTWLAVPITDDKVVRLRGADIAADENAILAIVDGPRRLLYHDMPKDQPETL